MNKRNGILFFSRVVLLAVGIGLSGCTDPAASAWVSGGTMLEGRRGHSSVRLDNGAVLIVGGENATGKLATAEMRDTATLQWSSPKGLKEARSHHAAIKRSDGSVMVVGGKNDSGLSACIEVFRPDEASFSSDGSWSGLCPEQPVAARVVWSTHVGIGVDERSMARERIVVTNGVTGDVRLYDPQTSAWSGAEEPSMLATRAEYAATSVVDRRRNSLLGAPIGVKPEELTSEDGAIVVAIGGVEEPATQPIAEYMDVVACAKDATKCAWRNTLTAGTNRRAHTATWIGKGEVLVVGGKDDDGQALATVERYQYDFDYDTWTLLPAGSLLTPRYGHTATRLNNGNVLVVGGWDASNQPIASIELYDTESDGVSAMPSMSSPRAEHTATWLPDGSVLVVGGLDAAWKELSTTERFVPQDPHISCTQTVDCPQAMVCNTNAGNLVEGNAQEGYCEQAAGPLGSRSACAVASASDGSGCGAWVGWSTLVLGAWLMRRRRSSRLFRSALVLGVLLLVPRISNAQTPTFYLDRLPLAGGPEDGTAVWRPVFGRTGVFGQIALGYVRDPLRVSSFVYDANQARALHGAAVHLQVMGYATAGVELAKRGSIQVSLPYVVTQRGYSTNDRTVGLNQVVAMAPSGLGDMRVAGRMLLLWNEARSLVLGAQVVAYLPTGNESSFLGEGALWGQAGLSGEYNAGAAFFTVNAGLTMRPRSSLVDLTVGSELAYAAGFFIPLSHDRLRVGAEIWGALGLLARNPEAMPVEAALSGRFAFGPTRRFSLGLSTGGRLGPGYAPDMRFVIRMGGVLPFEEVEPEPRPAVPLVPQPDSDGDGFVDFDDRCPLAREDFKGAKEGCPETDEDRDGIDTVVDACPLVAEDKDGLADEDGCPDDDFDGDGFADMDDKCPREPGVQNEDPAKLGCPRFIERTRTEVVLHKQIDFEFQSATIAPASYPILDEIAKLLQANLEIKQLRIEGHTDNLGDPEVNREFSLQRARAVRDYLVRRGKVDSSRLSVAGFGQTNPIAPNDTPAGRAKNRRVELHIGEAQKGEENKP